MDHGARKARPASEPRRRRRPKQLEFHLPRWGGARKGAGRKPRVPGRAGVRHVTRPFVKLRTPVHVTWRVTRDIRNLRRRFVVKVLWEVFRRGKSKLGFGLAHFSVQRDHLHLIVEGPSTFRVSRGL